MSSRKYFGTDGVRGTYGSDVMNEAFAWRLGAAAAQFARTRQPKTEIVFIGRDTRASGESLERALASGLASAGLKPVSLGVIPTPAVSFALRTTPAALGVVITASHNPAADNGIKFFGSDGTKLSDADELAIEQLLPAHVGETAGIALATHDAQTTYIAAVRRILPEGALRGWKIVLDTANGAACITSRTVLEQLGAELVLLGNSPDGNNINAEVGSQHPEKLCATVLREQARLGIAHDGDADRCVLCDERGMALDGDEILTILAVHELQTGSLVANALVLTVQSNLGVDQAVAAAGGTVSRTAVGDRYVSERMLATGARLGGESSGHVICADVAPTGDGLVAALKVIAVMRATAKPLSELRTVLKKFPQGTASLRVREKIPLEKLRALPAEIRALEDELGARGRVLVRYSGTEPKLRLMVEGPDDATVAGALQRLDVAARSELVVS